MDRIDETLLDYGSGIAGALSIVCAFVPIVGPFAALALGVVAVWMGLHIRSELLQQNEPLFKWGRWWWLGVGLGVVGILAAIVMGAIHIFLIVNA